MTQLALTVNGRPVRALVEPRTHLADFLREQLYLTGTHLGCEQGVCGACTINIDGVPQRSCIAFAVDCDGSDIRTIEGFDDDPLMAELREAFSAHHGLQCGYCTPGMLITARDMIMRLGEIEDARIREELSGNLCRCTGYVGIVNAIRAVAAGKRPQTVARIVAVPEAQSAQVVLDAATPAPVVTAPPLSSRDGQQRLTERITLNATPEAVWIAMSDLHRLASCLPGAEITDVDGQQFTGAMQVALGPIKATFSGRGTLTRNDAAREGSLAGQGRDTGSGSLAHGEARFTVRAAETGQGTVVDVTLTWRLSGTLAQFSRTGLVQSVVRQIAVEFASNLEASIAGVESPPPKPLRLFAVLWAIIKARLFRH